VTLPFLAAAWLLGFALLHLLAELHEMGASGAEFRVSGRFCHTCLLSPSLTLPVESPVFSGQPETMPDLGCL